MLNSAGRTCIIALLAPVLCIGVLIMFVAALCDFTASRFKGRSVHIEPAEVMEG
jgi:hypothetical protein